MLKKTKKAGGKSGQTVQTARATYAIVHGLAEGPFLSLNLRHRLEAAGFAPAKATEADIVITHSGGCFAIPANTQAKLFLHINPSYWPGKSLIRSVREKVTYDFRLRRQHHQLHRWAMSLAANILYSLNLKHAARMARPYFQAAKSLSRLPDSTHVFIRTHIDSYCDPHALLRTTDTRHSYLTLAGHHDDCWRDPEPYVKIVQALYN